MVTVSLTHTRVRRTHCSSYVELKSRSGAMRAGKVRGIRWLADSSRGTMHDTSTPGDNSPLLSGLTYPTLQHVEVPEAPSLAVAMAGRA